MSMCFRKMPAWLLKGIQLPPQILYALGLGPLIGGLVMLLTTRGRKSGKWRTTPLQYEWLEGDLYVAAMRGERADWYRNLLADPHVRMRVGSLRSEALAEPVRDPQRVIAFLQECLRRRPRMLAFILKADGVGDVHDSRQLAEYAKRVALVVLQVENLVK